AEAAPGPGRLARAPQGAMAPAVGDAPELLVVLVDERPRMAGLVASDGQPGRAIQICKAWHARAAQDRRNGGRWVARERTQPIGSPAQAVPGLEDPGDVG